MKQAVIPNFSARYGPWAVVAGASVGLGAEFATQIAQNGLNLVLLARRKETLDALAATLTQQYAIEVRTLELDLSRDDIGPILEDLTADLDVGLLVYNAASSLIAPFFERTLEDHINEVMVNCRAPLTLAYIFGQRMLKRSHGGIVLMSSLSSTQGSALIANYAATKAYNRILAEGLWEELRTQGIDVLSCNAGAVSTPGYVASLSSDSGEKKRAGGARALSPGAVVSETLAALGRGPIVIPGRGYRLANLVLQRLLPHTFVVKLMGRVMRDMYQH